MSDTPRTDALLNQQGLLSEVDLWAHARKLECENIQLRAELVAAQDKAIRRALIIATSVWGLTDVTSDDIDAVLIKAKEGK
jgi:hypothetical protein